VGRPKDRKKWGHTRGKGGRLEGKNWFCERGGWKGTNLTVTLMDKEGKKCTRAWGERFNKTRLPST